VGRGRRVERTPPKRVGPPPKGRVVQLDFDVRLPQVRVIAAAGKSEWCVGRLGVRPEDGCLCTCARGAAERACGPYAAVAREQGACMQTCVHYADQLCQCAECALRSAAPCSGVPRRLPTAGGSFDAEFRAAPHDADRAAQPRQTRLQRPVEAEQLEQHVQEQLPLQIVGHSIDLALVHDVVVVQVDHLGDVNAQLRFPAAGWSGHSVHRLCIIPLADCASKTSRKLVEIGRDGSSVGQ